MDSRKQCGIHGKTKNAGETSMEHLCGKQVKSDSTDKGCLTRHIGAGNKDRTATKRNVIGDTMLYKRMIKALCMKRFTLVTSFRKSIIGQARTD